MRSLKKTLLMTAAAAVMASTAHAERGSDGNLNILYWQAASILNPYLSGGTKDIEASSMVIEPLAYYDENGNMVTALAAEIPTVENGGVSKDLTSITWKLKQGVKWSDGSAFTAGDVAFTAAYCLDPSGGCQQSAKFTDVTSVEAVDDHTVKITFGVPKPFPYGPFVGTTTPILQKAQFENCMGAKAPTCTDANFGPHGTGPFTVTEFKANDVVTFAANTNYREEGKPAFATATFKGGGDAASAARSVLETGEFDYAWNLQVEPEVLSQMAAAGKGKIVTSFGTSVERLMVNFTNPSADLGDERATVKHAHPFLSDPAVRKALSMAIDRQILVDAGYGAAGQVTCNVLPAPAIYASTANDDCKKQDVAGANKLLDDAGWAKGSDGIRAKDGVRLSILYQTSTNSVRQGTQAFIKQMWAEIGVETELRNIDAAVFFGGDQSSPDTFQKFFADIEMYTNNFDGTDPEKYMANWHCNQIPAPGNQWLGNNMPRYCNEEYNALVAEMGKTASLEKRAELAKKMNDMLMQAGAMIPLIHRGDVSAHSVTLDGVKMNSWDSELWNVQDWSRKK
ncbi:MAG: peptide ABC transporter substrate-binding protein [Pseudomonadota bacterium]